MGGAASLARRRRSAAFVHVAASSMQRAQHGQIIDSVQIEQHAAVSHLDAARRVPIDQAASALVSVQRGEFGEQLGPKPDRVGAPAAVLS